MTMNKTEYEASIKTNLTIAEALCADLRKLCGLAKLAKEIPESEKLVAFDVLDKTVSGKEAELKKVRAELQKARRVVKKMEEIEAIETGTEKQKPAKAPAAKKPADKKETPATKKSAPKKTEQAKAGQTGENPAA